MRHSFAILAVCLLSLTGMAQKTSLEGTWRLYDANNNPTSMVKVFMPDGKVLGLSFNSDFTNSGIWYMSNYEALSDTSFVEHVFFHSDIYYQTDNYFTYHTVGDSLRITNYSVFAPNGGLSNSIGRWKKIDRPMPTYTDEEWQSLYQKSLADFGRLPKEGQTVEQFGQALYDEAQRFKKENNLVRAGEALLLRAELDTTNRKWQQDMLTLYHEYRFAPTVTEKIADRIIRMAKASAPTPADTSVLNAYRQKAFLYNYRGNAGMKDVRRVAEKVIGMETAAGHQPSKEYGLDYMLMAMSYMTEGKLDFTYDFAQKTINVFEQVPNMDKKQLGEAYFLKAMALSETDRYREKIDILMNKVAPLFVDEQGQPLPKVANDVYPSVFQSYGELLKENPKDKKSLKEYQQFMSDKLLCAVFETTNREYNLWGEYVVLEMGTWTIEKPIPNNDEDKILLQKGDEYVEVMLKDDEKLGAKTHVKTVDAATKNELIKQWKAYRKKNKKK